MKIKMTSLYVQDPIKAHQFYTEVLDFVTVLFMPEAKLAIVAAPEEPQGTGLLLEPNEHPVASAYQEAIYNMNLPAMVFGVDDIEATYLKLKERGVIFRKEPRKTDWGYEALLEDTCGNLVQLHQS